MAEGGLVKVLLTIEGQMDERTHKGLSIKYSVLLGLELDLDFGFHLQHDEGDVW